jgi:hypothetical protein
VKSAPRLRNILILIRTMQAAHAAAVTFFMILLSQNDESIFVDIVVNSSINSSFFMFQ